MNSTKKLHPRHVVTMLSLVFCVAAGCSKTEDRTEKSAVISAKVSANKTALPIPNFVSELPSLSPLNMDDGPFYGAKFSGDVSNLTADESVPFRGGTLLICNRQPEMTPVLVFKDQDGKTQWAVDLDPSVTKDYEESKLVKIYNCTLEETKTRQVLHFIADWDYGHEHGYAFFSKNGEFGRFFLSW